MIVVVKDYVQYTFCNTVLIFSCCWPVDTFHISTQINV